MGKILLIDVDGTLVNYENQLPASAASAIRKARANGHKVYICTGCIRRLSIWGCSEKSRMGEKACEKPEMVFHAPFLQKGVD